MNLEVTKLNTFSLSTPILITKNKIFTQKKLDITTTWNDIKSAIPMVRFNKKILSSFYYGVRILNTFGVYFLYYYTGIRNISTGSQWKLRHRLIMFCFKIYLHFFFSSLFCFTHLRNCTPSSPYVPYKTCDFVSRRRVLLLKGPSKSRKKQSIECIYL